MFPKVAPDLVPGAAKMNQTSKLVQRRLAREQIKAAKLKEKKKVAKNSKKKGAGKKNKKVEEPAEQRKRIINPLKGKRQLFWYDVFNTNSRRVVAPNN